MSIYGAGMCKCLYNDSSQQYVSKNTQPRAPKQKNHSLFDKNTRLDICAISY